MFPLLHQMFPSIAVAETVLLLYAILFEDPKQMIADPPHGQSSIVHWTYSRELLLCLNLVQGERLQLKPVFWAEEPVWQLQ